MMGLQSCRSAPDQGGHDPVGHHRPDYSESHRDQHDALDGADRPCGGVKQVVQRSRDVRLDLVQDSLDQHRDGQYARKQCVDGGSVVEVLQQFIQEAHGKPLDFWLSRSGEELFAAVLPESAEAVGAVR